MPATALLLVLLAAAEAPVFDCGVVPGFSQEGSVRSFDTETLFDYINGSSEGYFVYGFERLAGVSCVRGATRIVLDISQMGSAEEAWGMYMANRDGKQKSETIGAIGQVLARRAVFVKGPLYVELQAEPAGDHESTLRNFVAALDERIEGETTPPAQLAWFPTEGLEAESVRLVPESVLGIRALRRGYVGIYDVGKAFVVTETSPDAAAATVGKLRERFAGALAVGLGDEAFMARDDYLGEVLVFRKGAHVAGIVSISPGKDGQVLARSLAARLP